MQGVPARSPPDSVLTKFLGYHLRAGGHTLSVQNRPTGLSEDVFYLAVVCDCKARVALLKRCSISKSAGCVLRSYSLRRVAPCGVIQADDAGLARKESVIDTLCGLPDGLAGRGFRVSASIPKVMFRRRRPLDPESRSRRAFFARHLYCFFLCFRFCHWLFRGRASLVRQLRGPQLSTCQWCSSQSSIVSVRPTHAELYLDIWRPRRQECDQRSCAVAHWQDLARCRRGNRAPGSSGGDSFRSQR